MSLFIYNEKSETDISSIRGSTLVIVGCVNRLQILKQNKGLLTVLHLVRVEHNYWLIHHIQKKLLKIIGLITRKLSI